MWRKEFVSELGFLASSWKVLRSNVPHRVEGPNEGPKTQKAEAYY